jgi:predicted O-methyltransferase YrrM
MNITNDKVTEYINGFYRPLTEDLKNLRERSEEERVPIILKETETYLINFLKILKPKSVLEIGTAVGYSSMVFKEVLKDAKIVTLEKDEDMAKIAKENMISMGYDIDIYQGDAREVIESLSDTFDLVFIDAAKSHYREFFDMSIKKCKRGAVIISDNVLLKASTADDSYDINRRHKSNIKKMREYLNYLNERKDLSTAILSCGDGLAITKLDE